MTKLVATNIASGNAYKGGNAINLKLAIEKYNYESGQFATERQAKMLGYTIPENAMCHKIHLKMVRKMKVGDKTETTASGSMMQALVYNISSLVKA